MYLLPLGVPNFVPPQAMTINCLPFTAYVDGVAKAAAGKVIVRSSFPVLLV